MTHFEGRAAFVTGAGSGIGRALARALAAEGAAVAVADVLMDHAGAVADEIRAAGGTAVAIPCDVSDRASVGEAKVRANAALGPVSLLVLVAGVSSFQPLTDMSDDDVDWIFGVNLMGVVHALRAFLPDMLDAGDGHVLATASIAGLAPGLIPRHAAYSSAKLGVIGLILNLRHELAEHGVGATVYCPSFVASEMGRNQVRARPARFGPGGEIDVPADVRSTLVQAGLVPRDPEAVAPEVLDALRENRPIVFNASETPDRERFLTTYVAPVLAAFDVLEDRP